MYFRRRGTLNYATGIIHNILDKNIMLNNQQRIPGKKKGVKKVMANEITQIKSSVLSDKEVKFIHEYQIDGNGTRAVIAAGYKTKSPARYA